MRKRFLGVSTVLVFALIISTILASGQQRRGPAPVSNQAAQNLRIKYKTTSAGQTYESISMIKGSRERNEMRTGSGMDTVNITQCDLKRTIQLSERVKKYVVTPMESNAAGVTSQQPTTVVAQPVTRGGVVTYTSTATDTGERKEMFGFTARHVKTTMTMESSPDACNPINQKIETDGWYIDLSYGVECDLGSVQMARQPVSPGGCRDRVQFRRQGSAKTGYPLIETMTMYGPDGRAMFTTTKEVVELSREPLDAALFDIPANYTEAKSTQEFYATPSVAESMAQSSNPAVNEPNPSVSSTTPDQKKSGTLRVGVVHINNRSGKEISTDTLRDRLIGNIDATGIDAIALNAISQSEAEAEAKIKQCDFILYTDIAALKTSAAKKLGGVFGRVAGVEGINKTEARLDFRLFAVGESSPRLQASTTAKEEGDETSAGTAIDAEAKQVTSAIRKRS